MIVAALLAYSEEIHRQVVTVIALAEPVIATSPVLRRQDQDAKEQASDRAKKAGDVHRCFVGPAWLSKGLAFRLLRGDLLRAVAARRAFVSPVATRVDRETLVRAQAYPGRY